MYHFFDDFKAYDDACQPYSLTAERSSALPHTHAAVDSRGFSLQCPGNKYILLTPPLSDFRAAFQFMFSPKIMPSTDPYQWSLIFGYAEDTRNGYALTFQYFPVKHHLTVCLERVKGFRTEQLASVCLPEVMLAGDDYLEARAAFTENSLSGHYAGHEFALAYSFPVRPQGSLALARSAFVGEVVFRSVSIQTDAEPDVAEIMPPRVMEIPSYNGGQLPYRLSLSVGQYGNGKTFMSGRLEGGLSDRPRLKPLNGQYLAAMDRFTKPYVRLAGKGAGAKVYFHPHTLNILDINVHWDFLKDYFDCADLPICFTAGINALPRNPLIIFGYENAESRNFLTVSGGPTEYVFDLKGTLLYMGESLEKLSVSIESGENKKIIAMIPSDIPHYQEAVWHAVHNHYFFDDEAIGFDLVLRAPVTCAYTVKASIENAFYTKLCDLQPIACEGQADFQELGLHTGRFHVNSSPLPLGVYHIVFELSDGPEFVRRQRAAFEVFDGDETHSPQKASGLPYLYSKCNEMRYLKHDVLDFLSPLKSYDAIHYFTLAGTIYADVGSELAIWRLLRLYRREWLVGLSGREVQYPHWSHWREAIRNAAYVEYMQYKIDPAASLISGTLGINRHDLFKYEAYDQTMLQKVDAYLLERPQLAEKLSGITSGFDRSQFAFFLKTCAADWLHWFAAHNKAEIKQSHAELIALNPSIKFSGYNPYPLYAVPYGTHHTLLWFGYEPDPSYAALFNGVAQFEDYPFSCSYPTYRGALAGATLRLWCPNLNLTPELYRSSRGGCPDGLVGYANPPFGKYWMPPYFQASQILEYVFATPILNENGFDYWRSDGAMLADPDPHAALPEFIKRWESVVKHRPVKPQKAMMFLTDYPDFDERISFDFDDENGWPMFYNISEANQCHLYAAARQAGLNVPIMTRFSCLGQIDAAMTDILVLPSLSNIDDPARGRLRDLYAAGISLIACGSVDGLEDLFGVCYAPETAHFNTIRTIDGDGESERVQPVDAEILYRPVDAAIMLCGESADSAPDAPLFMTHGRTALLNIAAPLVGPDTFMERVQYGRESISVLFKDICGQVLRHLSKPKITADCGLAAFRDAHSDMVMLFDYSAMTQINVKTKITEYQVTLHGDWYTDAVCERSEFPIDVIRENGYVRLIRVKLRPQETMLIELME